MQLHIKEVWRKKTEDLGKKIPDVTILGTTNVLNREIGEIERKKRQTLVV